MRPYDWCHPGCPNPCSCQETIENKMRATKDALTDGQAAGDGERVETAALNASLTPDGGDPVPAPAACPCDGTDCVC